jgi:hypothetical protein
MGSSIEVPYLSAILSVLADWAMGRLRIFLCYRRDDTRWVAGRLYDELRQRYGREQVFQDITAIRPGIRYTDQIQEEISRCDVLVVVMGEGWLLAADPQGRRRLDSPRDLVRLEIAAALQRDIPIIPVLVQRASMPADVDLPDDIADLTLYHACEVTDTRWDYDVGVLLKSWFHNGCSFGAGSSGMEPGGLTQELLCGQFVSVRCPGVGAAARNLVLMQMTRGHPRMLGSHLQFGGGLLVETSNLRAWITHGRPPSDGGGTADEPTTPTTS